MNQISPELVVMEVIAACSRRNVPVTLSNESACLHIAAQLLRALGLTPAESAPLALAATPEPPERAREWPAVMPTPGPSPLLRIIPTMVERESQQTAPMPRVEDLSPARAPHRFRRGVAHLGGEPS
jgi:hypothetical protein